MDRGVNVLKREASVGGKTIPLIDDAFVLTDYLKEWHIGKHRLMTHLPIPSENRKNLLIITQRYL